MHVRRNEKQADCSHLSSSELLIRRTRLQINAGGHERTHLLVRVRGGCCDVRWKKKRSAEARTSGAALLRAEDEEGDVPSLPPSLPTPNRTLLC